jgi:hypothetical protein
VFQISTKTVSFDEKKEDDGNENEYNDVREVIGEVEEANDDPKEEQQNEEEDENVEGMHWKIELKVWGLE